MKVSGAQAANVKSSATRNATQTNPNPTNATPRIVSTVNYPPNPVNITRKHGQLLSLPDNAIYCILRSMRYSTASDQNTDGHQNMRGFLSQHKQRPECRHTFIRPAFPLAQTCKKIYALYRNLLLKREFFGKEDALSPSCDPGYCFTPSFNRLRMVKVVGGGLFSDTVLCQFIVSERAYGCDLSNDGSTIQMEFLPQRKMILVEAMLTEKQLSLFFQSASKFQGVRRLHMNGCPMVVDHGMWKLIAQNWKDCLQLLIIEDSTMMFQDSYLTELGNMNSLDQIRISSQSLTMTRSFLNLPSLKALDISSCMVYDEDVARVLLSLNELQFLDVSDTFVSPKITAAVPPSLRTMAAGERIKHRRGPISNCDQNTAKCLCFVHLKEPNGHLSTCEVMHPGVDNPRWHSKNNAFVRPDRFPVVSYLSWGHWGEYAQGIAALSGVIPTLQWLTLSGKDYDDELATFLISATSLTRLELLGCNVTDITAFAISKMMNLQQLDLSNCVRISVVGLYAIAEGRAARTGNLKYIRRSSDEAASVPSILRTSLLANEGSRHEILTRFRLR